MIERTTGFKVGDTVFATIEDAQRQELMLLFAEKSPQIRTADCADAIIENRERILDILTTTPDSRPKARRIHGGTKPRKTKAATTVLQPDLGEQREMGVKA